MKFATLLSTLLAAAVPINAAQGIGARPNEFIFELPSIIPGAPNPSATLHFNLTGIDNTTFTSIGAAQLNQFQHRALEEALKGQMHAYIQAYQDALKLAGQTCDLLCCEGLCFLLVWIPFATAVCIKMCEAAYEP